MRPNICGVFFVGDIGVWLFCSSRTFMLAEVVGYNQRMNSLQKARQLIEALPSTARVIELAGPTPDGNQFLRAQKIRLAATPLITNRKNPVLFYGLPPYPKTFTVDEIADVHNLNYRDVDMIMCSYLPWYNDRRHSKELFKRMIATLHYKARYVNSRANPHISLFRESAKALKPSGLLLVEGVIDEDFAIARKCGFTVVCRNNDGAALFSR